MQRSVYEEWTSYPKAKVKTNLTDKQVREKFIPCRGESKSPRFNHFCLQQFMQLSFSLFFLVLLHRFLGLPSCSRNAKTVNSKSLYTETIISGPIRLASTLYKHSRLGKQHPSPFPQPSNLIFRSALV